MVFRHVLAAQSGPALDTAAAAPSMSFFSEKIGLSGAESTTLAAEAQAWQAEVAPIDKSAYAMIASIRAKTPGGHLAPGEQPPAPPEELKTMQAQKDAVTLKHVQHLHTMLGEERFAAFDQSIRFASQGQPIPSLSHGR